MMREAIKVLRAVEGKFPVRFNITEAPVVGGIDAAGDGVTDSTPRVNAKSQMRFLFALSGLRIGFTVPKERPKRAALLRLRKEFQLFANLRTGDFVEGAAMLPMRRSGHGDWNRHFGRA